MGFLIDLYKLTRFDHAIMLAIAVLIGEAIVLGAAPPLSLMIVLSLLVPMLSEAGSFALNDYLDIETDKINKKLDRPLVRGTISPAFALYFSITCISLSIALAFFINLIVLIIAVVFNGLAILYNWKLKDLPLVGNIYIGFTMSIPFIFGNVVVASSISPLILLLASLGFLSGLAREILKSVQDMEGDIAARKSKTLPIVIGARPSIIIACISYLAFVVLSISLFFIGLPFNLFSGVGIVTADLMIIYLVYALLFLEASAKLLRDARNMSLAALFIGMVGILVAVIYVP